MSIASSTVLMKIFPSPAEPVPAASIIADITLLTIESSITVKT
jgi:hypothetical protein